MPLLDVIQKQIMEAMKARNERLLATLRMMKTALMKEKVDSMKPLTDAVEMQVLKRLIKQRQRSGRPVPQRQPSGAGGKRRSRAEDHRIVPAGRRQRGRPGSRRRGRHRGNRRKDHQGHGWGDESRPGEAGGKDGGWKRPEREGEGPAFSLLSGDSPHGGIPGGRCCRVAFFASAGTVTRPAGCCARRCG